MAININIPKQDPDDLAVTATRGNIIKALLGGGAATPQPAMHENALVDNAFGFMPHVYSPNDIITG